MLSLMGSGPRPDPSLSSITLELREEDYKFTDVIGMPNEIELLKNRLLRAHFESKLKAPLVKTLLLYGPPGTGKSKLSRVIAAEFSQANKKSSFFARRVNIFHVNTGKLIGTGIGETLQRITGIFQAISALNPAVLIVDDIDALVTSANVDSVAICKHLVSCIDNDLQAGAHVVIFVSGICDPATLPFKFQLTIPCYPLDSAGRMELLESYALKWGLDFSAEVLKNIVVHTRGVAQVKLINLVNELVSRQFFSGLRERPKWPEVIEALIAITRSTPEAPFTCFKPLQDSDRLIHLVAYNVNDVVAEVRTRLLDELPGKDELKKLLYVHHPQNPAKMKGIYESLLNDVIIPAVLQHPALVDSPSFVINEDSLKEAKSVSTLLSFIREANAYQKPCFLLIQNFPGIVAEVCQTKEDLNAVASALNLCSPQVFIILTASAPCNKLPIPLRDAVQGLKEIEIQPVTDDEKVAFLRQAFDVQVVENEDGQPRAKFARLDDHLLFERAKEVAKSLSVEDLKDFQARLLDAKALGRKTNDPDLQAKVIEAMEEKELLENNGRLNRSDVPEENDANSEIVENGVEHLPRSQRNAISDDSNMVTTRTNKRRARRVKN